MKHRQSDPVPVAAAKADISRATAYRLAKEGKLPSQKASPRGRRRPDPLRIGNRSVGIGSSAKGGSLR